MPKIDGMEVAKQILTVNPRQGIILATYVKEELSIESLNQLKQVAELLQKPFGEDPTTKQPKWMLDNPTIGLVIKLATFSYVTRILFISSFKRDNRSFDSLPLTKTKTWQLSPLSIIFNVLVGQCYTINGPYLELCRK